MFKNKKKKSGWGIAQFIKSVQEWGWVWIPIQKAGQKGTCLQFQHWKPGDTRLLGQGLLVSQPSKSASSRFSQKPYLKNKVKNDWGRYPFHAHSTHVHMYVRTHKHLHTYSHIQLKFLIINNKRPVPYTSKYLEYNDKIHLAMHS